MLILDSKILQNARIAPQSLFVLLQHGCSYDDSFLLSNIGLVLLKL